MNQRFQIVTPTGLKAFAGILKTSKKQTCILKTETSELKCSLDHLVINHERIWVKVKQLSPKNKVIVNGNPERVVSVRLSNEIDVYDAVGVNDHNSYITNGFVSHNCSEFLGSTGTLLNSITLRRLVHKTPIATVNSVKVYENPVEGHDYVLTVDCSEGVGGDDSAFNVIDITSKPYKQVVVYNNKHMNPLVYPDLIYQTALKYNNAFVLVEINSIGKQVADALCYDLMYENLGWVGNSQRTGQILMGGNAAQQQNGLRTTTSSKRIGCSNLKQLVESGIVEIVDADTILQLSTFIQKGKSFEADDGCKDDIVMSLVVFGWTTTQEYFKSLNNSDARRAVLEEYKKRLETEMMPQIFSIALGTQEVEEKIIDNNGIVWSVVNR